MRHLEFRWHLELFQLWEDPDFSFFEIQIISHVAWLLGHTCSALSIESIFFWMNQGPWTIQLMEDFHLQTEGRNYKGLSMSQTKVMCLKWMPMWECWGVSPCENLSQMDSGRRAWRASLCFPLCGDSVRSTPILWPRTVDYRGLESISLFPTVWGLGKVH